MRPARIACAAVIVATPSDAVHTQYAPSVLRVEPHTLPALRSAFDQALTTLIPHLKLMAHEAVIEQSWLGDESSAELREFYNQQVMLSAEGPFAALVKYQNTLQMIRDQLAASEAEYERVEGENSELWGRA